MGFENEVFRALNETGIRYVVVGGLAVVLHGYIRQMKRLAGRPKDLVDLQHLLAILKGQEDGDGR